VLSPISPWSYRSDHLLEHIIKTQQAAAARNIRPKHFWRFRRDLTQQATIYLESGIKKKYDSPIFALLYIKPGDKKKSLERVGVVQETEHDIAVDLAECFRLGQIYQETNRVLGFPFYLPQSGDVYQWDFSLYEISDIVPSEYYEPVQSYLVWKGAAALLRIDSTAPEHNLKVLTSDPELEHPVWLR